MHGSTIRSVRSQYSKVNGIGEIGTPTPLKPLDQFGCHFKYITTSVQVVDVQNVIKIDSAVAALRMREKTGLGVFFVNISIYLSTRLSVLRHAYGDFNTKT